MDVVNSHFDQFWVMFSSRKSATTKKLNEATVKCTQGILCTGSRTEDLMYPHHGDYYCDYDLMHVLFTRDASIEWQRKRYIPHKPGYVWVRHLKNDHSNFDSIVTKVIRGESLKFHSPKKLKVSFFEWLKNGDASSVFINPDPDDQVSPAVHRQTNLAIMKTNIHSIIKNLGDNKLHFKQKINDQYSNMDITADNFSAYN